MTWRREVYSVVVVNLEDSDYFGLEDGVEISTAKLAAEVLKASRLDSGSSAQDIDCPGVATHPRGGEPSRRSQPRQLPFTFDDCFSSPCICRPVRRADYCMVNDGAVALILRRADSHRVWRTARCDCRSFDGNTVGGRAPTSSAGDRSPVRYHRLDDQGGARPRRWTEHRAHRSLPGVRRIHRQPAGHNRRCGRCERGFGFEYIQNGRIELSVNSRVTRAAACSSRPRRTAEISRSKLSGNGGMEQESARARCVDIKIRDTDRGSVFNMILPRWKADVSAERRPGRTLGPPHDEFWSYCSRRDLRIRQCRCGHYQWPPAESCDVCSGGKLSWTR
jgi:hypothetical protein